jgi:dihydroorotase
MTSARPATPRLEIPRPDDWHVHLRDGPTLARVVGHTARVFGRAIVMPNLAPPVVTVAQAQAYRERIIAALPESAVFEPLMTLYLTAATSLAEIERADSAPFVHAVKYYPAGATTGSEAGLARLEDAFPLFAAMERAGLTLCVHGESIDPAVDIYDRERVFVERALTRLVATFPGLPVVFEHVTTSEAVDFVVAAGPRVAATITPQHLLHSRNALFDGGLRPHLFCRPVLKREAHRQALVRAATSGNPKFFLGTDSAPHARHDKESACGCAGCYSAPIALELYAEAFEDARALDRLAGFASHHGADFYGLPRNRGRVVLERRETPVAGPGPGDEAFVPLRAGGSTRWRIAEIGTA